jgi:hypothetical protein
VKATQAARQLSHVSILNRAHFSQVYRNTGTGGLPTAPPSLFLRAPKQAGSAAETGLSASLVTGAGPDSLDRTNSDNVTPAAPALDCQCLAITWPSATISTRST